MATQTPATKTPAVKTEKVAKPQVPVAQRVNDQLKRAALTKKITNDELDGVIALANALKTFLAA